MKYVILSPEHEKTMQDFQADLVSVNTIDDMFPPEGPDPSGVREPRFPCRPEDGMSAAIGAPVVRHLVAVA